MVEMNPIDGFDWWKENDGSWRGIWNETLEVDTIPYMPDEIKIEGHTETRIFRKLEYKNNDEFLLYVDATGKIFAGYAISK